MKTMTTSAKHTLPPQRRVAARHGHVALASLVASSFIAVACSAPGPGVRFKDDDSDMSPFGGNPLGNGGTSGTGPGSSVTPGSVPGTENPAVPMDVLIDDLEDGNGNLSAPGFAGRWTTYSDGTSQVAPPADTDIVPVEGAIHVTGSNFNMWGVGLSVDLNNASGARQPVDLSDFRGLSVRARGTGSVEVELVLPATTGTEEGGTCSGEGCFGHYAARLTLGAAYTDHQLEFEDFNQPEWGQPASLDLTKVLAINFLSRAAEGAPSSIDLYVDSLKLLAAAPPSVTPGSTAGPGTGPGAGPLPGVADGSNPFAGQTLHSDNGAAFNAYNSASGAERDLLGKIAMNPTAFWLVGGDPGQAGRIAEGAGGNYPVIVVYNIPNRDCNGQSAGGAGSPQAYEDYIDGVASSLQGKRAAIILEPDALALSCGASTESLLAYAVASLRSNPGTAVYLDGGHSNWIPAGEMANRLRSAGIEQATGFAINVSNFQPTDALVAYGRALSGQVGNKPFVIDTSRNGKGSRGDEWCNPAGAGLGELPTTLTPDAAIHALLWVKRPGESDGACGQCSGTPAGQFCRGYAIELAQNAVF